MGNVAKKSQCPQCAKHGNDRSKNNLITYEDGSCYCFACGYVVRSKDYGENEEWVWEEEVVSKEKLTEEEIEQIKAYTGVRGNNLRGITDETYKYYAVRHKYSEETGEPVAQDYPITEGYQASGFKVRNLPKDFTVVGKCGKESDLFGQWRYKSAVS